MMSEIGIKSQKVTQGNEAWFEIEITDGEYSKRFRLHGKVFIPLDSPPERCIQNCVNMYHRCRELKKQGFFDTPEWKEHLRSMGRI